MKNEVRSSKNKVRSVEICVVYSKENCQSVEMNVRTTYRTMSAPLDDIQCDFFLAAAYCKAKPESGGSMNGTTWYLAAGRHAPMAATI